MDGNRFDDFARGMAGVTRRATLRAALAAAAAGPLALLGARVAEATCRGKGKACKRDGQCCSGRCKKGECRPAPGQDTCNIEKDICAAGNERSTCGPAGYGCACYRRLNGQAFCGNRDTLNCGSPCASDQECATKYGADRVCVRAPGNLCCGGEGIASACVRSCVAGEE